MVKGMVKGMLRGMIKEGGIVKRNVVEEGGKEKEWGTRERRRDREIDNERYDGGGMVE